MMMMMMMKTRYMSCTKHLTCANITEAEMCLATKDLSLPGCDIVPLE